MKTETPFTRQALLGKWELPSTHPQDGGREPPRPCRGAGLLTSPCRCHPEPGRKSAKWVWVGAAGGGGGRGCGVLGGQPHAHHSRVQDRDPGTPPFTPQDSSEETHCVQRLTDAPTHGRHSASNRPRNPCDRLARGLREPCPAAGAVVTRKAAAHEREDSESQPRPGVPPGRGVTGGPGRARLRAAQHTRVRGEGHLPAGTAGLLLRETAHAAQEEATAEP